MTSQSIGFQLEIKLGSAWQVGTGRARGLLHRTTCRNAIGEVYITASTIKGRLRGACEQIVRLYSNQDNKLRACQPPRPQDMCRGSDTCIVCRLFGSPYVGERLFFEDAVLTTELHKVYEPADLTSSRTRIKLDRRLGVAETGHLFSSEYSQPALSFRAGVSGKLPLTTLAGDASHAYELLLLAAGVRMVKGLGGDKSVGFGGCEMSINGGLRVGSDKISPADLLENWLEYFEFYGTE